MVCGEVVSSVPFQRAYIYLTYDLLLQKFAFTMGWMVAVAESLMFINVLVGCVVVKRKG